MMKINMKITKIGTGILESDKEIVDIDICNGNWKYIDCYMQTEEKIPLTINTLGKARFLHLPVKDAYPRYNWDLYHETGDIEVNDAIIRSYDNLLNFLNCRIKNVKDDYKRYDDWKEQTFTCIMFEEQYVNLKERDIVEDIVFNKPSLLEVKIEVID